MRMLLLLTKIRLKISKTSLPFCLSHKITTSTFNISPRVATLAILLSIPLKNHFPETRLGIECGVIHANRATVPGVSGENFDKLVHALRPLQTLFQHDAETVPNIYLR